LKLLKRPSARAEPSLAAIAFRESDVPDREADDEAVWMPSREIWSPRPAIVVRTGRWPNPLFVGATISGPPCSVQVDEEGSPWCGHWIRIAEPSSKALGCSANYWTTRKMRFEFGLTITRRPATKALPLPSGLVKTGTSSGTTWPGMTIPEEPARGPRSGGR
jgi:hypothetical protein